MRQKRLQKSGVGSANFFDMWNLKKDPMYVFTAGDHAAYTEGDDFLLLFTVLNGQALKRAEWLRGLLPQR